MLEYIRRIAVFIIMESVILGIVTNEDYKKFIKMCSGMIMVILVLSPLDKVFGFKEVFTETFTDIMNREKYEEIEEVVSAGMTESVREEYEELLLEQIGQKAYEYGYTVSDVNVVFDENEDDYIGSLNVVMEKCGLKETDAKEIGKISIKKETVAEHPAVIAVKNFITDNYGLPYEKITVQTKK